MFSYLTVGIKYVAKNMIIKAFLRVLVLEFQRIKKDELSKQ